MKVWLLTWKDEIKRWRVYDNKKSAKYGFEQQFRKGEAKIKEVIVHDLYREINMYLDPVAPYD